MNSKNTCFKERIGMANVLVGLVNDIAAYAN